MMKEDISAFRHGARTRCALVLACWIIVACPCLVCSSHGQPASSKSWSQILDSIKEKYYLRDLRGPAISDIRDAINAHGNGYSDAVLFELLKMEKEYFGTVNKDLNFFGDLIRLMFFKRDKSRIDKIVKYFQDVEELHLVAAKARTGYFTPMTGELSLAEDRLNVHEETTYAIRTYNREGVDLGALGVRLDVRVTTDNHLVAVVEESRVRGLRAGTTNVVLLDGQRNRMDEKPIEVLSKLILQIDPGVACLREGQKRLLTVLASKPLDGISLQFKLDPEGHAELKKVPPQPNSKEQKVELTGKLCTREDITLNVSGDEGAYTHAKLSVLPRDPEWYKPAKTWPIASSSLVAALFAGAVSKQLAANGKRADEEDAATRDPDAAKKAHQEYVDVQRTATFLWVATTVSAVGAGYLWYRFHGRQVYYQEKKREYEEYGECPESAASRLRFQVDPRGELALVVGF